jgi:hypothetical protein
MDAFARSFVPIIDAPRCCLALADLAERRLAGAEALIGRLRAEAALFQSALSRALARSGSGRLSEEEERRLRSGPAFRALQESLRQLLSLLPTGHIAERSARAANNARG